ncbi:MAG: hypothetical protein IJ298_01220 [Ruminococcus sp.]|nr:hypothetical protein [Ruminococcus sp.]
MKPIIALLFLCLAEILLSDTKKDRFRNIETVIASALVCLANTIVVIVAILLNVSTAYLGWITLVIQASVILGCKLYVKKRNSRSRYIVPVEYISGKRGRIVSFFYKPNEIGPGLVLRDFAGYIGLAAFISAAALYIFFLVQTFAVNSATSLFTLPDSAVSLISLLIEIGIFLSGTSVFAEEYARYQKRKNCRTARELANARYSLLDDYEYIFRDNYVSENNHILRATKQHYLPEAPLSSITFYDFKTKTNHSYKTTQTNIMLERFIKSNNLEPNELYCAAYNLIDENQNVLIKTPSYVDFEPYLAAIIKQKVAKTEKLIFIVNSSENQSYIIENIKRSFTDYFGFKAIPVFSTLEDWFRETTKPSNPVTDATDHLRHIKLQEDNRTEPIIQPKHPDVIIASPDDICDPLYTPLVRKISERLGLIVYYNFSDCVQEHPLYAKIVHSVLDNEDTVSTLYMTDGFCDLEQTLDNFFSARTIYTITAPRAVPETSYDMVWKHENAQELQFREITDASRNFGTHIAILYYALRFIRNDAMVVADEYDAYAENILNYNDDRVLSRVDHHVGWSNVVGGESVFCTVSDTYNNIPHTYLSMRGIGRKNEYINIISRPYLLRKYLAYNLKYFSAEPGVLTTFSSGIIKTPRAIATEAVALAYILGCKSEQLTEYAKKLKIEVSLSPAEILSQIAYIAYDGHIDVTVTSDVFNGERYHLDKQSYTAIMDRNELTTKMIFSANDEIIRRAYRDYRYLVPHQKIVLNGTKYTVLSIKGNKVELTNSNNRDPVYANRIVRTCTAEVESCESYGKIYQHGNDSHLDFSHLVCNATINVLGRIAFTDSYSLLSDDTRYNFNQIDRIPPKTYSHINIFKIRIGSSLINDSNRDSISHMFALLFHEMLPTFFPKHHDKIMVSCSGWSINQELRNEDVGPLHIVTALDINDPEPAKNNEICMYIMEDSSLETGTVNVFWQDEEFRYMLKILEDYLYHIEFVDRDECTVMFSDKYKPILHTLRKILLMVINEQIDGDADHKCINSIRVTRNKFNNLDYSKKYVMKCDFCGNTISNATGIKNSYHYYNYSGMISCPTCYAHSVCSENYSISDIKKIEEGIHVWLADEYGAVISEPFYNYLEDAEFIAKRTSYANRFIVTDDTEDFYVDGISSFGTPYSPELFVGINSEAVPCTTLDTDTPDIYDIERASYRITDCNHRYVLIRDGLPRSKYEAVLCHETAHQWQFDNLDPVLMEQNTPGGISDEFGNVYPLGSFRYEGHAMWAEIQYLKKNNRRKEAKKIENSLKYRNDVYGFGYRWMCDLMKLGHRDPYALPYARDKEFMKKLRYYQLRNNAFGVMLLYYGKNPSAANPPVDDSTSSQDSQSQDTQT